MKPLSLSLAVLFAACSSELVQEIECEDRDLNRGGSVHVIEDTEQGALVDVVWCDELTCDTRPTWYEGLDVVVDCPAVGEDESRGSLWVWVVNP